MAMMVLIGARVVLRSLSFQTPSGRIELESRWFHYRLLAI